MSPRGSGVLTYEDGKVYAQTGKARIAEGDEFVKRAKDHIAKYRLRLDEHGRDSMGIPLFDEKTQCVIEVTPKRIIYW